VKNEVSLKDNGFEHYIGQNCKWREMSGEIMAMGPHK
jgi:hypothetical protein